MRTAILTVTPDGEALGRRLASALGRDVDLYGRPSSGLLPYPGGLKKAVGEIFHTHRALVFFLAAGAVVRLLAPHLGSKARDPAVVVVDGRGEYAVSLLSGHRGGGNLLAERVAAILGGRAVVTTASDTLGKPALDLWLERWGLRPDPPEALTGFMARLVAGEEIRVYGPVAPPSLVPRPLTEYSPEEPGAKLVLTSQVLPRREGTLFLRPPELSVGVGCRRGVPADTILAAIERTLEEAGLSPLSLSVIASIDRKADEPGLLQAGRDLGLPLRFYRPDRLAAVSGVQGSDYVLERMGVAAVCEPAALLAGSNSRLLVPKRRFSGVTVAVAGVNWWSSGSAREEVRI